jgi:hypothetical protein
LLFCGVDNPEARRLLDVVNPAFVVEAGLGSRYDDFKVRAFIRFLLRERPLRHGPGPRFNPRRPLQGLMHRCCKTAGSTNAASLSLRARPSVQRLWGHSQRRWPYLKY